MRYKLLIPMLVLILLALPVVYSSPASLNTSLGSYWHVEENGVDFVDEMNVMNLSAGSQPARVTGFHNFGQNFTDDAMDGSDLYESQDLSWQAWFRIRAFDGSEVMRVFDKYDGVCGTQYGVLVDYPQGTKNIALFVRNGGSFAGVATAPDTLVQTGVWYHAVWTWNQTSKNIQLYINGTLMNESVIGNDMGVGTCPTRIGGNTGDFDYFNGDLDELAIWTRVLTASEVAELWNSGAGVFFPDWGGAIPPVYDYINLSTPLPENESAFNTVPVFFNVTANISLAADCNLWINDTLNQTQTGVSGTNVDINFNVSNFTQGIYTYKIGCNTTNSSENTTAFEFIFDLVSPDISTDFLNNSLYWTNNFTATINISDDVLLHGVNISIDGVSLYNDSHVHETFFQYNLSENATNYSVGSHTLTIWASDGHTAAKLKDSDDYNAKGGRDLTYDIKGKYEKQTWIKMYNKNKRSGDLWSAKAKNDRFSETYVPFVPEETMTFIIESDREIHLAEKPGMYGGQWLIIGNHWKDFVLENEPNAVLSLSRKSKKKYEVTLSGLLHPEKLSFHSTGDLNINEVNYTFYIANLTERYTEFILSGFTTNFYLDMLWNLSGLNTSAYNPVAILEWNNTNYTATQDTYDADSANFSYALSVPYLANGSALVVHRWFFNYSNLTQGYFVMPNQSQNWTNVTVGECNSYLNFSVLNISYYDEVSGELLSVDANNYNLIFYDGTYYYNLTGNFNDENESNFCTNLNPGNISYVWNMWGVFTLEEEDYVTRIFTIDSGDPTAVSNDPETLLDLYMIGVSNSSTVTFTWLTTEFQQFDGTMKLYTCNNDSTRSLVESVTIINGLAYANLELLFTPYSYEVVIEGTTYTGAWTECHIEAATEREYIVDLLSVEILPVIGLFLVDCHMTNSSNDVTMTWSANPEDTTTIEACIVGKRQSIYNMTEVYRNCSNQTAGSFTVTVPSLSNEYQVTGEITQNGYKGYCRDTIVFGHDRSDVSSALGGIGLLCIVILVLSLALMYSGSGEKQVIAASVGVLVAFFLGLTSIPWPIISAICFLSVGVVLIGRYTKYGSVF